MTPSTGRPSTGAIQIKRSVTLDDETVDKLRAYGFGSLSLGIRRAAALIPHPSGHTVRDGVD